MRERITSRRLASTILVVLAAVGSVTAAQEREFSERSTTWPSGQVMRQWTIYMDATGQPVRHGVLSAWQKNGTKTIEFPFIDGSREGKCRMWYRGNLIMEIDYLGGRKHGKETWWWPNGTKRQEGEYRQGAKHGQFMVWNFDGSLRSTTEFDMGREINRQE